MAKHLSDKQRALIKERFESGESLSKIAAGMKITGTTASKWAKIKSAPVAKRTHKKRVVLRKAALATEQVQIPEASRPMVALIGTPTEIAGAVRGMFS